MLLLGELSVVVGAATHGPGFALFCFVLYRTGPLVERSSCFAIVLVAASVISQCHDWLQGKEGKY